MLHCYMEKISLPYKENKWTHHCDVTLARNGISKLANNKATCSCSMLDWYARYENWHEIKQNALV